MIASQTQAIPYHSKLNWNAVNSKRLLHHHLFKHIQYLRGADDEM